MGLLISVYRNSEFGDCTNNGISNRYNKLCVTNVEGPFNPDENTPGVKLVAGPFNSVRLECQNEKGLHTMMGGNYGGTSDSRFADKIKELCGARFNIAPIHDRIER